jgi:hypothetical protein
MALTPVKPDGFLLLPTPHVSLFLEISHITLVNRGDTHWQSRIGASRHAGVNFSESAAPLIQANT